MIRETSGRINPERSVENPEGTPEGIRKMFFRGIQDEAPGNKIGSNFGKNTGIDSP